LKSLTDVNGIAGYERNVKAKMKEYLEPVSDEIIEDITSNAIYISQ
jgi:putative aminopeptidase FrvX